MNQFWKNKIYPNSYSLQAQITNWRQHGDKIVFTNGCFDLLHPGHIDLLSKAASLGNRLVIGVNTDQSVGRLKGIHRPIQNESSRLILLAALEFTDAVVLFDEPTPLLLIQQFKPDILVKGGDYSKEGIVGAQEVESNGGEVRIIPFLDGFSTTAIEKKITQSSNN